ncbi:MAG: hypothetical protein PVJ19_05270 [Desulfobacteraceae bacterium]|jgi:hypothetical protein
MIDTHLPFKLPGGLLHKHRLYRQAQFLPLTGHIEFRMADVARSPMSELERIIEILGCTVRLGPHQQPDPGLARLLCLGDRQYLMLRLSCLAGGDMVWLHPECEQCNKRFDLQIRRSKVPVKSGGKGYPYIEHCFRGKNLRFRVPNGEDELSIRGKPLDRAIDHLLHRCLVHNGKKAPEKNIIPGLTPDKIETIEHAMDEAAPDVGSRVETVCPECGQPQVVPISINGLPDIPMMDLYQDIHLLAQSYSWHEADILALPSWRRKLYIRFIDRTRGFYG